MPDTTMPAGGESLTALPAVPVPAENSGDDAEAVTLAEDLRLLADDAKDFAQAEFAYQKARAAYAGAESKAIAGLMASALVLVFFATMALVVGTVIALGPVLGLWGAMGAVTLGLASIAALCLGGAAFRAKRLKRVIADSPPVEEAAS